MVLFFRTNVRYSLVVGPLVTVTTREQSFGGTCFQLMERSRFVLCSLLLLIIVITMSLLNILSKSSTMLLFLLGLMLAATPVLVHSFVAVPVSPSLSQQTRLYNAPRHDTGNSEAAFQQLAPALQQQMLEYQQHQLQAPKLDFATDVRTLVQYNHGFAVMSTHSKSYPDFPGGSVVGFAVDPVSGQPVFCFSGMSSHTVDILSNPHCSLTVASKQFKGAADGRVNLMGKAVLIKDPSEIKQAEEWYNQKHPGAFWTAFGDFNWFRMTVEHVRFVGGFARAGTVTAEEYATARADPVAAFGPHIAQHMNDDHQEATMAILKSTIPGLKDGPVMTAAEITAVDSLGMFVKVTREQAVAFLPQQFKVRVPFPRPAGDRADVKKLIVEMTQPVAGAAGEEK